MSEIPYFFETPVPKYFRENGWFDNENTFKFITWAFSKCSKEPRKIVIQNKEIILAPFEFIAGRLSSSQECFLTQKEFRGQLFCMIEAGILKKTANSKANKYSSYIWIVERFTNTNQYQKGQQKGRQRANRGPTEGHNLDYKIKRLKEDHPSIPSLEGKLTDDFFSAKKREEIEICQGVFMTKETLATCIKLKGDIETVKQAVEFIQNNKKRTHEIVDWPNALAKWKIENKIQIRIEENIAYAEQLCKTFKNFEDGHGWRCIFSKKKNKDQKCLLFQYVTEAKEPIFLDLADGEFKQKCDEFIKNKNMSK